MFCCWSKSVIVFIIGFVVTGVAAKLRFYTGGKFKRIERFADIVISTESKPCNLVRIFIFCRQHDNREKIIFAYLFAQRKAINIGKHYIKDCEVEFFVQGTFECIFAIVKFKNLKTIVFEIYLDKVCNIFFIVYYHYICTHKKFLRECLLKLGAE